jgi:hypothetical protein
VEAVKSFRERDRAARTIQQWWAAKRTGCSVCHGVLWYTVTKTTVMYPHTCGKCNTTVCGACYEQIREPRELEEGAGRTNNWCPTCRCTRFVEVGGDITQCIGSIRALSEGVRFRFAAIKLGQELGTGAAAHMIFKHLSDADFPLAHHLAAATAPNSSSKVKYYERGIQRLCVISQHVIAMALMHSRFGQSPDPVRSKNLLEAAAPTNPLAMMHLGVFNAERYNLSADFCPWIGVANATVLLHAHSGNAGHTLVHDFFDGCYATLLVHVRQLAANQVYTRTEANRALVLVQSTTIEPCDCVLKFVLDLIDTIFPFEAAVQTTDGKRGRINMPRKLSLKRRRARGPKWLPVLVLNPATRLFETTLHDFRTLVLLFPRTEVQLPWAALGATVQPERLVAHCKCDSDSEEEPEAEIYEYKDAIRKDKGSPNHSLSKEQHERASKLAGVKLPVSVVDLN